MNTYDIDLNGPSITCKLCGLTSFHPQDVDYHYCARCHIFHDDPTPMNKTRTQQYEDALIQNAELRAELAEAKRWQEPRLAREQPCGCVVCHCEGPQCQGCGAKSCAAHPDWNALASDPKAVWEIHPLVTQVIALKREWNNLKTLNEQLRAEVDKLLPWADLPAKVIALQDALETAHQQGAEMRDFIKYLTPQIEKDGIPEEIESLEHLRSNDCGKDYVHRCDLDQANKACAEMRELLTLVHKCCCDERDWMEIDGDKIAHALSTDCGTNHVPKAELEEAQKRVAEMRQRIVNAHDRLLRGAPDVEVLDLLAKSWGEPTGEGYHPASEFQPLVDAIKLFVEWCSTPDRVPPPELIEAQHDALAHAKQLGFK